MLAAKLERIVRSDVHLMQLLTAARTVGLPQAVGVPLLDDRLDIVAPFGLEDLFDMIIRPNYALPNKATHERKATRCQTIWSEVRVIPWSH